MRMQCNTAIVQEVSNNTHVCLMEYLVIYFTCLYIFNIVPGSGLFGPAGLPGLWVLCVNPFQ